MILSERQMELLCLRLHNFFSKSAKFLQTQQGTRRQKIEEDSTALKRRLYALFLGLGLSIALLATAQRTEATLGESVDTVESDRKALMAVRGSTTVHKSYTVHEFNSNSNAVREYISPSGVVFGISWKGLTHPDLTQLLGSYAGEYQEALRQTPRQQGRRRLQVKTNRVVVEKWGHMRNLQGRAFALDLIPFEVSIDEIR